MKTRSSAMLVVLTALLAPAIASGVPEPSRSVEARVLRLLVDRQSGETVRVEGFPLGAREVTLDLTSFSVLAPGARIVVHDGAGEQEVPAPRTAYFRGRVEGEPGSVVFLAAGDVLRGFVLVGEDVYAVAPREDVYRSARAGSAAEVRRLDLAAEVPDSMSRWLCEGALGGPPTEAPEPPAGAAAVPSVPAPLSDTVYTANLAIETDYELYAFFGSTGALTQYVTDLVAAGSAIYLRDVKTELKVSYLSLWSTAADPWTATSTRSALYELGDYWHANRLAVPRTTVHFLSRKGMGGGIAWLSVLCASDFLCQSGNCGSSEANGHYGGGYGVSASLNGQFSTSNPALYWDILCTTHELGHNFSSPHTHCYSPAVDTCCPCEPASVSDCVGAVPPEKGTIMSYCHLRPGGYGNVKLFLGVTGETSEAVLTRIRGYVESRSHASTCMPPSSGAALRFYTAAPCRAVDTRSSTPPALAASSSRAFVVTGGSCGVPTSAKAVSVNATVVSPAAAGFLTLYPGNGSAPGTSNVNFQAGQTRANNAVVSLATDGSGSLGVLNGSSGTSHVLIDVNGYFQ